MNKQVPTDWHQAITTNPPIFPYPWATDWGEDQYGLWMGLNHKGVRCVFRWIDSGTFMMGSPEEEEGRYDDEDYHQVTLTQGFWAAETTVTQAMWVSVMAENPSHFEGDNRPVEQVSWDDCQRFIQKLNTFHPELEVCLPWEAEWEYACRAGTKTAFNVGEKLTLDKVNYRGVWNLELGEDREKWVEEASTQWDDKAKQETAEVKSYSCNAWGLYEMHGNVWEWCQDHWQENLGTDSVVDPQNERAEAEAEAEAGQEGARRVIRGGSWGNLGGDVRSAYRLHYSPVNRRSLLGFRLFLVNPRDSAGGGAA